MQAMRACEPTPPRVIIYCFSSPFLVGDAADGFCTDMLALCAKEDLHLVDVVIDRGPPKRRPQDYPALVRVARGEADGVLVVRSVFFRRGRIADRLEKLCPKGDGFWLPAEVLDEAGMLPRLDRLTPDRRPALRQRAGELRSAGLSLPQIGAALSSEGYRRRDGLPWSAETVAKLFGITVIEGGQPRGFVAES